MLKASLLIKTGFTFKAHFVTKGVSWLSARFQLIIFLLLILTSKELSFAFTQEKINVS